MLPISIVLAVVVFLLRSTLTLESVAGLLLALITTLAVRWVSNYLQLIRVRSWAVSSVFILLISAAEPIHGWSIMSMGLCALCWVHVAGLLFCTQADRPHLCIFVSTLALALMIMVQPLLVWLLPACMAVVMIVLRVWSPRTLAAIFLGLLLPWQVWAAWHLTQGSLAAAAADIVAVLTAAPHLSAVPMWPPSAGVAGLLALSPFVLISVIHFLRTSFDDKLSTRLQYVTMLVEWVVLLILFWPYAKSMVSAMMLCSAPFVARYVVFSRGWVAATVFWLLILTLLALYLCPCWFSVLPVS